jgi:flagellar basal body-associated protein FliL
MKNYEGQQKISTILFVIIIAILFIAMCTGCSTVVPVTAKFPEAPATIMQQCPQLEKLNDGAKLSDVAKTVTINYTTYYECAIKNDAWIEWYGVQKRIFETIK